MYEECEKGISLDTPELEITREMRYLSREVENLNAKISELVIKLKPVLCQERPRTEEDMKAMTNESALGEDLRQLGVGIGRANYNISDLTERILI